MVVCIIKQKIYKRGHTFIHESDVQKSDLQGTSVRTTNPAYITRPTEKDMWDNEQYEPMDNEVDKESIYENI